MGVLEYNRAELNKYKSLGFKKFKVTILVPKEISKYKKEITLQEAEEIVEAVSSVGLSFIPVK